MRAVPVVLAANSSEESKSSDTPITVPVGGVSPTAVVITEASDQKQQSERKMTVEISQEAEPPRTHTTTTTKSEVPTATGGAGAAAIALAVMPILVLQFFMLILPLRIVHSLSVENDIDAAMSGEREPRNPSQEMCSLEGPRREHVSLEGRLNLEGNSAASQTTIAEPTARTISGSNRIPSDMEVMNGPTDSVPAAIRRNLAAPELGVHR